MSLAQVARICGVTDEEVTDWWDAWELQGMQPPGRPVLIPRRELVRFMAARNLQPKGGFEMNELTTVPAVGPAEFEMQKQRSNVLANYPLLPEGLRGNTTEETIANCYKIVEIADRWNMSAAAILDDCYAVKGRFGFDGKLIAAVANSCGLLERRLNYKVTGSGDNMEVLVTGRLKGESEDREVTYTAAMGKAQSPTNKAGKQSAWDDDPEQKLCYSGAQRWVRRHCPEILFGNFGIDEMPSIADQPRDEIIETSIDPLETEQLAVEIEEAKARNEIKDRLSKALEYFGKHGISHDEVAGAFGLDSANQLTEANLDRLKQAAAKIRSDQLMPPEAIKEIADEIQAPAEDVIVDSEEWWQRFMASLSRKRSTGGVYDIRAAAIDENPAGRERITQACVKQLDKIDAQQQAAAK